MRGSFFSIPLLAQGHPSPGRDLARPLVFELKRATNKIV